MAATNDNSSAQFNQNTRRKAEQAICLPTAESASCNAGTESDETLVQSRLFPQRTATVENFAHEQGRGIELQEVPEVLEIKIDMKDIAEETYSEFHASAASELCSSNQESFVGFEHQIQQPQEGRPLARGNEIKNRYDFKAASIMPVGPKKQVLTHQV